MLTKQEKYDRLYQQKRNHKQLKETTAIGFSIMERYKGQMWIRRKLYATMCVKKRGAEFPNLYSGIRVSHNDKSHTCSRWYKNTYSYVFNIWLKELMLKC